MSGWITWDTKVGPPPASGGGSLWSMVAFYVAAGSFHFLRPDLHLAVLPPWVPGRLPLVLASGGAAIVLGVLLLVPGLRRRAALGIVVLLILLFPVHVYLVAHPEALPGVPAWLLVARLSFQLVLVVWALSHARATPPGAARERAGR